MGSRGALTEYAGCDGSGRETLAATALARAQAGGLTLLVDPDGTSDPDALAAAGVVLDALPLAYPTTTIQAWTVLDLLCRCGALDLVLVASVSGLLDLPGEVRAGRPARLFPRVPQRLRGRRTALLVINVPVPGDGWRTVADTSLAQVARLRVAFVAQGMCLGPHGDLVGLQTRLHLVKHRGHMHPAPLDPMITAGGPDHPLELVQLAYGWAACGRRRSACWIRMVRSGARMARWPPSWLVIRSWPARKPESTPGGNMTVTTSGIRLW